MPSRVPEVGQAGKANACAGLTVTATLVPSSGRKRPGALAWRWAVLPQKSTERCTRLVRPRNRAASTRAATPCPAPPNCSASGRISTSVSTPSARPGAAIGPKGSLEIVIPFNAPANEKTALIVGNSFDRNLNRRETLPAIDQYTAQAENFALAVLGEQQAPYGVEDAIAQMRVLDAIFRSEESGTWEAVR